jgi:hypothetical protein
MKPVWKWVIGIVIGLVVLAMIVGAAFLVRAYLPLHVVSAQAIPSTGQAPRQFDERGFGMRGFGMPGPGMRTFGGHGFGMMGRGMLPFGGFFSGLFSLGFLALLVLGIVWLVRSLRTPKPVEAVQPCGNCGKPVQAEWRNCPYCGKKL